MADEVERIFVIPLKKTGHKSSRAAPTAVKRIKSYLKKHMKVEEENIWMDDSLNNALWEKGKYKMPSKIRVKAVKFDDGVVETYIPEIDYKKSRREILKEEKAKKEPILKKEEAEGEEGEGGGAEDYDIAPSADGEVKIKKKKAPKEKKTKEEKPKEKKAKPNTESKRKKETTEEKTKKKETGTKKKSKPKTSKKTSAKKKEK